MLNSDGSRIRDFHVIYLSKNTRYAHNVFSQTQYPSKSSTDDAVGLMGHLPHTTSSSKAPKAYTSDRAGRRLS
jgi:hypothetical protein